jgi:hypothetical protein
MGVKPHFVFGYMVFKSTDYGGERVVAVFEPNVG